LCDEHGYQVHSLLDAQASKQGLQELLETWLPEHVTEQDRVLFYFAGHGVALDGEDGPRGYLLPRDAQRGEPDSYIEMTALHDALMALPCRHMFIVLDSCFSGAFRWSGSRDVIRMPGVVHRERYQRFISDPAWQLLTSAAYDQTAADQLLSGSLGTRGETDTHSPFALALFDALAGAADLVPAGGDGIITATELFLFLEEKVQPETLARGRRQTPGLWPLKKHDKGEYIFHVPGREMQLPPAPVLTLESNPWPGLSSYERDNADVFFGRDEAISELADMAERKPLTVVLGASGSGKSSLVKAGLVPALETREWNTLAIIRPGSNPVQVIKAALRGREKGRKQALVIDQFEELITMARSEAERDEFLAIVADLVDDPSATLRVIVTLRTDFEAHFQLTGLNAHWRAGRFIVPALSRQDLRAIIEQPATQRVLYFEPSSLVEELLDDVVAMPGALPLLSFTLSEMYRRYLEGQRGNRALTQSDYDALGGVAGALRTRADAEYENLDATHRHSMRRLMLRMTLLEHGAAARQRIDREELAHWDPAESDRLQTVLQSLCDARLLVQGVAESGQHYIEPAHDALVTSWGRLLNWAHSAQAAEPGLNFLHALSRTAADWSSASSRDKPGLLWRDKVRSDRLWTLRKHQRLALNRVEDNFCRASVARQRLIRAATLVALLTITVSGLLAVAFGFVAVEQREAAFAQRDEAQRQTGIARSNALAAAAGTALDGQHNPSLGLKLAAAALEINPANERAPWLIRRSVYSEGIMRIGGGEFSVPLHRTLTRGIHAALWSPDGRHIAVSRIDAKEQAESVEIFTLDGLRRATIPGLHYGLGQFSEDGAYYIGHEGEAWDLEGTRAIDTYASTLVPAPGPRQEIVAEGFNSEWYHAFSSDGRVRAGMGATVEGYREADDWQREKFEITINGELVNRIPGAWNQVALSPSGSLLATGNYDGEIALWRVVETSDDATRLATLWRSGDSSQVWALQFSPSGKQLLVVMRDGALRVWDLTWNPLTASAATLAQFARETPAARPTRMEATLDGENLGNDTPFVIINARDTVTNSTWSRNVITSGGSLFTVDDMLVFVDDQRARFFNAQGIAELALDMGSGIDAYNSRTDANLLARPGHLVMGPDSKGYYRSLPVSTEAILSIAGGRGLLVLTERERAAWDLDHPTEPAESAIEPAPTLTATLTALLTSLLWDTPPAAEENTNPEPLQEPPAVLPVPEEGAAGELVELPYIWEKLAQALNLGENAWFDFDRDSNPRLYLTWLIDNGLDQAVQAMNPPEPFLSGPHSFEERDAHSKQFGHYNPAFVDWMRARLLPAGPDSPMRRATQATYNSALRRMLRIHALSLNTLESLPELRAGVAAEYMSVEQRRTAYLIEAMAPALATLGPRPEAQARDFAFAMGFWIRRDLDGTTQQFRELMVAALEIYDPEFLVELQSAPQ
jgi:hypothetical protein